MYHQGQSASYIYPRALAQFPYQNQITEFPWTLCRLAPLWQQMFPIPTLEGLLFVTSIGCDPVLFERRIDHNESKEEQTHASVCHRLQNIYFLKKPIYDENIEVHYLLGTIA